MLVGMLINYIYVYSSPPANIATKTIPHDQMSAGSALYSPSDKTYNGTQC